MRGKMKDWQLCMHVSQLGDVEGSFEACSVFCTCEELLKTIKIKSWLANLVRTIEE